MTGCIIPSLWPEILVSVAFDFLFWNALQRTGHYGSVTQRHFENSENKIKKNVRFILAFSSRLKGLLLFQSVYSVCSKTQLDEKYSIRDKSIIYYIILNKSLKIFLSMEITCVSKSTRGL